MVSHGWWTQDPSFVSLTGECTKMQGTGFQTKPHRWPSLLASQQTRPGPAAQDGHSGHTQNCSLPGLWRPWLSTANEVFGRVCLWLGMKKTWTTPEDPQIDGLVDASITPWPLGSVTWPAAGGGSANTLWIWCCQILGPAEGGFVVAAYF